MSDIESLTKILRDLEIYSKKIKDLELLKKNILKKIFLENEDKINQINLLNNDKNEIITKDDIYIENQIDESDIEEDT